jgi:hypothetical protein
VKPNVDTLAAISAGYRRGAEQLRALRRVDIRASNAVDAIPLFDGILEMALKNAKFRMPVPLTKAQRVLFGVEK